MLVGPQQSLQAFRFRRTWSRTSVCRANLTVLVSTFQPVRAPVAPSGKRCLCAPESFP